MMPQVRAEPSLIRKRQRIASQSMLSWGCKSAGDGVLLVSVLLIPGRDVIIDGKEFLLLQPG